MRRRILVQPAVLVGIDDGRGAGRDAGELERAVLKDAYHALPGGQFVEVGDLHTDADGVDDAQAVGDLAARTLGQVHDTGTLAALDDDLDRLVGRSALAEKHRRGCLEGLGDRARAGELVGGRW